MKQTNLIHELIKKSSFYKEKNDKKLLKLINKRNIKTLINILIKLLNDNKYRESILKIFRKIKKTKGGNNNSNNNNNNNNNNNPNNPNNPNIFTIAYPVQVIEASAVPANSVSREVYIAVTGDLESEIIRLEQELARVNRLQNSQFEAYIRNMGQSQAARIQAERERNIIQRELTQHIIVKFLLLLIGLLLIINKYVILPMTNNVNENLTEENVINALEYNNQNDMITRIYEELLDNYDFISRLRSGVNNSTRNNLGGKSKKKHKKIKRRRKTKKRYNKK